MIALSVLMLLVNPLLVRSAAGREAVDPSIPWWKAHPVCQFELDVLPEDVAALRLHSRRYVPAQVRVKGETYRIGIHLKGRGSFQPVEEKPSLTLDFSRFDPQQQVHQLRKLHLNNSVEDASYLQ